jgi:predicted RND superfamily exporter protein
MVLVFILILAFYATKLEIDASSETLLLENDADLKFARQMGKRYATSDILVLTYSFKKDNLLSNDSLHTLQLLSNDLSKLPMVSSVTSILTVPLLQSSRLDIASLVEGIPTLSNTNIDKMLVKQEFLTSPLYKHNLVSSDFKTTALIVNLRTNERYFELLNQRNALNEKLRNKTITADEKIRLAEVKKEFKAYRDEYRIKEHHNIEAIRAIMSKYNSKATLFLGGVSMIANDIVNFVKNDLLVYGSTLIALLILILWVIFRQLRWVVLPILVCVLSVISTTGALGYFGWEITVISSNFIAMQLIITISIVLHLIVRYRELSLKYRRSSQSKLVLNTMLSKLNPSFFAIITTIAGFSSLVFSNIQPVINLGWMMSVGIALSLMISFIVFPAILIQMSVIRPNVKFENEMKLTSHCANIVQYHGKSIFIVTIVFVLASFIGASKLIVENSFINYFKSDTEIYKGMEVIDTSLGGTTPLDVIVTFNDKEEEVAETVLDEDEFDSFDDEFAQEENDEKYWFTKEKMEKIKKVHEYLLSIPEIGNVQSFGTLLQVGKILNNNEELDSFKLGLLYDKIPLEYKSLILSPYLNIQANQVRFATRIIDSNENLRRDELLSKMNRDLKQLLPNDDIKLSNLMVLYNNMLQSLFDSQIKTLGFVLLILLAMFVLLFRSIKLALIAVISNIVPIGIIFAAMGFGGIPLDIMTITIAAISIGIGVDDTIHYIHRFKEEFKKDHDYVAAMRRSHASIGYAMTYTSLAVIVGFSILVLSNLIPTIYFGLLTVVVMITILASALLLLPRLIIVLKPLKKI